MEKKIFKVFAAIQMISAIVTLGAIFIWSPVCSGMLTLESGAQVHMKCFYTGQAVKVLAAIMFITAAVSLFASKDYSKFQILIVVMGVFMFLVPTSSIIGVCKKETMACISTAVWIKGSAIAGAAAGVLGIFFGKQTQAQVQVKNC